MNRIIGLIIALLVCICLSGCGGGGGGKAGPSGTGAVEGWINVPQADRSRITASSINVSRSDQPPIGYIALPNCGIKVEIAGKVYTTTTDDHGHFKVTGLPSGKATVTVTPPLVGGTSLGEFFAFQTTMEVKENTTAYIGTNGTISLISHSANHLEVVVNQVDTSAYPTIKLYVSVIDPIRSTPIIGIGRDGFEVSMAGTPVAISDSNQVSSMNVPASFCLVLDRSGSMYGQPLDNLKAAAKEFVGYTSADDKTMVISFADDVRADSVFSNDKTSICSIIDQLESNGATALYDAIYAGIDITGIQSSARKAVIAMTDGGENASVRFTLDNVIAIAKSSHVPVYTIGLQSFDFTRERSPKPVSRARSETELQQIASQSGGEYFYAPQSSDLMGIYTKITQREQQQYIITIQDPNPQNTGIKTIEVKVNACSLSGSGSSQLDVKKFDYPVSKESYDLRLTQGFYVDGPNGIHLGQDIGLPEKTEIRAIGDGKIVWYASASGYGELVAAVEHDLGRTVQFNLSDGQTKQVSARYIYSIYGHIRSSQVRDTSGLPWNVGDTIRVGQVIGYVNDDAHNGIGGEHLHMGIRFSDQSLQADQWYYYGLQDIATYPMSDGKYYGAFSEVISQL